jgi:hypothetical protein
MVIVQNKKRMVPALIKALRIFIITETCVRSEPANRLITLPIIIKSGAPGGCPTCNLNEEAINSPQSQKLPVGSMVLIYTNEEMAKMIQPHKLLIKR